MKTLAVRVGKVDKKIIALACVAVSLLMAPGGRGAFAQVPTPPPQPGIGDFDKNGSMNADDGAAYIKAYGIRFATYGVTDDSYRGFKLPRRETYDWQVQRINDENLQSRFSIRDPEVLPATGLPFFGEMVTSYLNLPQQYLRELGRRRLSFQFFGGVGRLARTWGVTSNSVACQMVIRPTAGGYDGRFRFAVSAGVWSDWEVLRDISFTPADGSLTFTRQLTGGGTQRYRGQVDGAGERMAGTFRHGNEDPTDYQWTAEAQPETGGTELEGGFGARPGWEVGDLGPQIQFGVHAPAWSLVHEIGHTVWNRIAANDLSFLPADREEMTRLFTPNAAAATASEIGGTGYWSNYAATGAGEDFAETFTAYYLMRAGLERRAASEPLLGRKLAFMRDRVDVPDPGPVAARHPAATGQNPYAFMSRNVLKYKRGTDGARDIPGTSISRLQPAVLGTRDRLRVFAVGTDGRVYHRDILNERDEFSAWQGLSHETRLPVSALYVPERDETYLFMVGNDQNPYYRVLDAAGSPRATGTVPGMQTWRPLGAALHRGQVHLFAIDGENRVMFTAFPPTLGTEGVAFAPWQEVPGGARVRGGVFALQTTAGANDVLQLLALNGSFRIIHQSLNGSTSPNVPSIWNPQWREEASRATVATTPTLTTDGWLYVKGFGDGHVYRKRFGTGGAYELLSDL